LVTKGLINAITNMQKPDWFVKLALALTLLLLGMIAARPFFLAEVKVSADTGQFDYVTIISAGFLYQGNQGVLLLDRRNGNVWFIGKGSGMEISFKDPIFVVRLPLEKMNQTPR